MVIQSSHQSWLWWIESQQTTSFLYSPTVGMVWRTSPSAPMASLQIYKFTANSFQYFLFDLRNIFTFVLYSGSFSK